MSSRSRPNGFVLPLTLVALAVIGLSLWAALAVLDSLSRDLTGLENDLRLATIGSAAEGRVAYLVMSEPFRPGGIEINGRRISVAESLGLESAADLEVDFADQGDSQGQASQTRTLRLDNTPYRLEIAAVSDRAYVVRLQDDAGLFNFGRSPEPLVAAYLEGLDIDREKARLMAGALADYVDTDDLSRLNGAEKDEYRRQGLDPPANKPLREAAELRHVLHWAETMDSPQGVIISRDFSVGLDGDMRNVNSASPRVLTAWYGLDEGEVQLVLDARSANPLRGAYEVGQITGISGTDRVERTDAFPSRRLRVSVYALGERDQYRVWQSWVIKGEAQSDRPFFLGRQTVGDVEAAFFGRSVDGEYPRFPEIERPDRN